MYRVTQFAQKRTPFLFVVSYNKKEIFVEPLKSLDSDIFFKINGQRNYPREPREKEYSLKKIL